MHREAKRQFHDLTWAITAGGIVFVAAFGVLAVLLLRGCFGRGADSFVAAEFDLSGISRFGDNDRGLCAGYARGRGEIVVLDFSSRRAKTIISGTVDHHCPVSNRDGTWIAFSKDDGDGVHVWLKKNDATLAARQITFGPDQDIPVGLSRNGKFIVVERAKGSGGMGRLVRYYLVNLSGAQREESLGRHAYFNPESESIYVNSGHSEWFERDLGGKTLRQGGTGDITGADADGRHLLVARYVLTDNGPAWRTWLVTAGEPDEFELGTDVHATISRDGKYVAVMRSFDRECEIVRVSPLERHTITMRRQASQPTFLDDMQIAVVLPRPRGQQRTCILIDCSEKRITADFEF